MVSRALIGRLTLFLILVLPPILPSSGISGVDYWLPYDLARYAPDVIPLQCNGPNTTWDHEASPDSAVCFNIERRFVWFDHSLLQETNMNMWQEGSILPVKLIFATFLISGSVHRNHGCSTGAVRPSSNPNELWGRPNGLWHLPHPRWGQRVHL